MKMISSTPIASPPGGVRESTHTYFRNPDRVAHANNSQQRSAKPIDLEHLIAA
jgi:hypothetical protein